jgi:hypothetical protein
MTEEKPRGRDRRTWIFIAALGLVIGVYGDIQYTLRYDPSSLEQDTTECNQGYAYSRSASDTAHVDSITPKARGYARLSSLGTCGYFRAHGSIRPFP